MQVESESASDRLLVDATVPGHAANLRLVPVTPHAIPVNSSHAPAARNTTPAARAIQRPNARSFSNRISNARSAIQSTFITPPTKSSAMRTQQQPTQYAP